MTELTDSFKPVDPEIWEAAEEAVKLFKNHFWRGYVLRDVNSTPITDVGQLTACLVAGTWPAVRPFDSGSQFADWQTSNCSRCVREENADMNKPPTCPVLYELQRACFGSGYVSAEIAERAGWKAGEFPYVWECGEVEWTESWKAEHAARNGSGVKPETEVVHVLIG